MLFKGAYPLLLVTEVFQHIYFHYFLIEDLPYNFSNFLLKLNFLNFQFLPNLFTSFVPSSYVSPVTPTKFKEAVGQTTFLISSGHYFTLIIFYMAFALAVTILKNKKINKFNTVRRFFKKVFMNRIRFNAVNECLWFGFITFVTFGFWQFKDFSTPYTWSYANHVIAILTLVICLLLVAWNVYLSVSYRKEMDKVPTKYGFIVGDESLLPFQMPLRYVRKLFFCGFLVVAIIELQIIGLIAVNFMVFAFYLIYKPSKSSFSNYINILIELSYLALEITILLFVNSVNLSTEEKIQYGTAMLALSLCALGLSLVWMVWQFLLFLYDFKFIREIVEETKLANQIHPDEDNLKIDFDKEYEKNEIISH